MPRIEGGWSFTAYSNREAFAMEFARGFSTSFSSHRMEDLGTYPGNARNSMIEVGNDRKFIEAGNLAVLQCHGNPYSIDLEYVPQVARSPYFYKWGERGRLQWVLCSGCDVLGFPVYPDGRPSSRYPDPSRWMDSFKGLSGILGYRSGSWYAQNNPGLGRMSGNVLAEELVSGRTFWGAWRAMADFLHRRLSQKAEACLFANSVAAVADTLKSYALDRTHQLDMSAMRRALVGHGSAAYYHYCDRVDESGNYICNSLDLRKGRIEIARGLSVPPSATPTRARLPTFEVLESRMLIPGEDVEYQVRGNSDGDSYTVSAGTQKDVQELANVVAGEIERTEAYELRLVASQNAAHEGRRFDARHAVFFEKQRFDLLDDFGVLVEDTPQGTVTRQGPITVAKASNATVLVGWDHESIFQAFRTELLHSERIDVERIEIMYQTRRADGQTSVYPVVVCYAVVTGGGSQRCEVRVLG